VADDMGILRTDVEIESHTRPGVRRLLRNVIVDSGAELSWAPAEVLEGLGSERAKKYRFQQADDSPVERDIGFGLIHVEGPVTTDEIVFGEPDDLILLGARSLAGLNLKVDLVGKRLVNGGPILAVSAVGGRRPAARHRSRRAV
jgi:predicted aspartyl protease